MKYLITFQLRAFSFDREHFLSAESFFFRLRAFSFSCEPTFVLEFEVLGQSISMATFSVRGTSAFSRFSFSSSFLFDEAQGPFLSLIHCFEALEPSFPSLILPSRRITLEGEFRCLSSFSEDCSDAWGSKTFAFSTFPSPWALGSFLSAYSFLFIRSIFFVTAFFSMGFLSASRFLFIRSILFCLAFFSTGFLSTPRILFSATHLLLRTAVIHQTELFIQLFCPWHFLHPFLSDQQA